MGKQINWYYHRKTTFWSKSKTTDRTKRTIVYGILHSNTYLRKLSRKYNLCPETIRTIIKSHSPDDPIKPYKQQCVPRLTIEQKS